MADSREFCLAHAAECREQAAQSTLANVRDRFLRSADTWQQMADRAGRVEAARAAREAMA